MLRPRKSCPNFPHYSNRGKIPPRTFQSDYKVLQGCFSFSFWHLGIFACGKKKDLAGIFQQKMCTFVLFSCRRSSISALIGVKVGGMGLMGEAANIQSSWILCHRTEENILIWHNFFKCFNTSITTESYNTNQKFSYSFSSAAVI